MGIFQEHPHHSFCQMALENGIEQGCLEQILADFEQGMKQKALQEKYQIHKPEQLELLNTMYETFHPATFEDLDIMVPHSKYMHGKFYYINEQEEDTCIPYKKIADRIKSLGFQGHIAAEYEGHFTDATVDCVEQLRRYSNMMHRLLG